MTRARNFLSRREFFRRATLGLTGALFALRHQPKATESNQAEPLLPVVVDKSQLSLGASRHLQITRLVQDNRAGRLVCLSGGEEVDDAGGRGIRWNQPEVLRLAGDAPAKGAALMAYLEENHSELLAGLWGQAERAELARAGLLLDWDAQRDTITTIPLPAAELQGGFTLAGWFKAQPAMIGEPLLLTMENDQSHLKIMLNSQGLTLQMADGEDELHAEIDRLMLADGVWHHVVLIADEDAGLLRWLVDGACQQSWAALTNPLPARWEAGSLHLPQEGVVLGSLHMYNRSLRTAEAAASYRYYGQGMGRIGYWG